MNKILRSISAVLALLLMLAACNRPPDETRENTSDTTTALSSGETTTAPLVTTTPPETKPPETSPPETTTPKTDALPPQPPQVTYPSWNGRSDVELLATLDPALGDIREVSQYGGQILLSYAVWDEIGVGREHAYAQVLDLKTGMLAEPIELSDALCVATFLDNGNVCVYDQNRGIAEVYGSDGQKQYTYMSQDDSTELYLDPSEGGTLWVSSWETPSVTMIPLDGDPVQVFDIPVTESGYILGCRDGALYYSVWNGNEQYVFALSKENGIRNLPETVGYYWGGNCFYTDSFPNRILNPNDADHFYQIHSDKVFSTVEAGKDSQLVVFYYSDSSEEDGVVEFEVLDYEKGVSYPTLPFQWESFYTAFTFADTGKLYFVTGHYSDAGILTDAELCRWNYCHDPQPVEVERLSYESPEASIAEVAQRIEDKWGVKVFYQPQLIRFVAPDYSADAVTDLQLLYSHILQLEKALSAYPQGYFEDLCYGDYTHLELYLCGTFTPLTSDGIDNAEALANTRGTAMVIGFNVYYLDGEYTRVLAHELLHIMERRLDQIDFEILSGWMDLTPGGYDAYYFSYHDENGYEMNDNSNTYYFESDPADAYFVDAYSKSFPTEDRARVFEKLMECGGDPWFADSPVLMAKARFLCRIIRENFPSVAAVERASWELK